MKECTYEDSDYKPCELQAMDCENCEYFCEDKAETSNSTDFT